IGSCITFSSARVSYGLSWSARRYFLVKEVERHVKGSEAHSRKDQGGVRCRVKLAGPPFCPWRMSYGKRMKTCGDTPLTVGELYPELDEEARREAGENLDRYVAVVLRICERIRQDPEAYAELRA